MNYAEQIKQKLGISGILTNEYAWRFDGNKVENVPGAQIDLLIDRSDGLINICEMKYSKDTYTMTAEDERDIRRKNNVFTHVTKTKKAVHTVMVTTYGLNHNAYSHDIQNEVTMDDLFL